MRIFLTLAACTLLLAGVGVAQTYDAYGNLPSSSEQAGSDPGPRAPGDIINTIYGPLSSQTGLTRTDPANNDLYMIAYNDGTENCYVLDDSTGSLMSTFTLSGSSGDFGLGYDTTRSLFVTCNASSDVVKTFNMAGTLVSTWSSPGSGPVGAAYDSTRDVYWICDWNSNTVNSVNPTTGTPIAAWPVGGSRLAGVAYCPNDDILFVGARDQKTIYALDAATGAAVGSFAGTGGSNNIEGLAHKDSTGTVFQSQYETNEITEFDGYCGGGPVNPSVDIKCNGGDSGVSVPAGTNATVKFKIVAGSAVGTPVDVWVVMKTPFGFFSYDGVGFPSGWHFGLGYPYHTGPLGDVTDTALDQTVPVGGYVAFCGVDNVANGNLNLGGAVILLDSVDFRVY